MNRTAEPSLTVRTESDLHVLEADWRRLESKTEGMTAFQTWEWVHSWWCELGRRRKMIVIEVRQHGEIIAMACLGRQRLGAALASFDLLTPLGQEHADAGRLMMGDCSVTPLVLEVLAELVRSGRCVVNLPRLDVEGPELSIVAAHSWPAGIELREQNRAICPVLEYANLDDPAADIVRKAKKRDVPRLRKRLEEKGVLSIELRVPFCDGIDELLDVYDRRWTGRDDEQGLFASDRLRAFIRCFGTAMSCRYDTLWLSLIRIDGRAIAGSLGYVVNGRYLYHKSAFDPEFKMYSPGHLLIFELAQAHLEARIDAFDFGRGQDESKYRWANSSHELVSYSLSRSGKIGAVNQNLRHLAMGLRIREDRR